MVEMVREKKGKNELELHNKKNSSELFKWKEKYKENKLPEFFFVSKKEPLYKGFRYICENMNIEISENERYVYFLDYIYLLDEVRGHQFGNLTPDYVTFVNFGIPGLRITDSCGEYSERYNHTVDSVEILIDRIIGRLKELKGQEKKIEWFETMKIGGANHFEEAIQRILFVNQVMWQTDHRLIGIGALDSYLYDFYIKDMNDGFITKTEAMNCLRDFMLALHDYYWLKSNMLMGDTGQIIVVGKSNEKDEYIYNDLTKIILEIIKDLRLPDPKVLLRVNRNMPDEILDLAVEMIASGIGSPLLSNDEVVIPRLLEFGVSKEDAFQYTVSACWEPLIGGKSVSLNNMTTLNFMRPMENLFKRDKLENIKSFDDLVDRYEFYLEKNLKAVKRVIDGAVFQYDTVMSVFTNGCLTHDASQGGATYFNAGITTVAMGNVVDSLLNIKKYVFEGNRCSLFDIKRMLIFDFDYDKDVYSELKSIKHQYGIDNDEIIELTKKIAKMVSKYTVNYRTPYGGRLKFGLSAPTYIDAAQGSNASFDGRRAGDPYRVHISNDMSSSYTELLNFSAAMDYGENRFNGNVVDLMVNPGFILENREKFKYLILGAINQGFFQMQANVVSSEILIDAREHPDKHLGLIVRVWGFSAYFCDLPESYKQLLIERALTNEGKKTA